MDLGTENISSLPIWIQLPDLDLKYWGTTCLSKICSSLGIPLKTDRYTKDRAMIKYARVLVDMKLEGPFPECLDFFNENEVLVRQEVKYEWLPTKCQFCNMFGHKDEQCRKKPGIRQEWRPMQKTTEELQNKDELQDVTMDQCEEGFVPVRRRANATLSGLTEPSTPLSNSYQILAPASQDQENREESGFIFPHG